MGVKLNTDEASKGNPGTASVGAVLRYHVGHFIAGFSMPIGWTTAFIFKLWALWQVLRFACKAGFRKVEVEVDSKALLSLLSSSGVGAPLLQAIDALRGCS